VKDRGKRKEKSGLFPWRSKSTSDCQQHREREGGREGGRKSENETTEQLININQ